MKEREAESIKISTLVRLLAIADIYLPFLLEDLRTPSYPLHCGNTRTSVIKYTAKM
jgi:hypothetical protein